MVQTPPAALLVQRIIAIHLGINFDRVTSVANLKDDLGADSLDVIQIVMAIEEDFNIEIPDDDYRGDSPATTFATVADIVTYVNRMAPARS